MDLISRRNFSESGVAVSIFKDHSFQISDEFGNITLSDYDLIKIIELQKNNLLNRQMSLNFYFSSCLRKLLHLTNNNELSFNYLDHSLSFSYLLKYFEKHRSYHNDTHIQYVLEVFYKYFSSNDSITELEKSMIEMALIWHDVEYLPQNSSKYSETGIPKKSNEELSAELCSIALSKYNISNDVVDRICDLIKATTHYYPVCYETDKLKSIICDIDLFRLSEPFDVFQKDRSLVRREYPHITDEQWIEGSKQFAAHFLKRNRIYNTPLFISREQKARDNLAKLL